MSLDFNSLYNHPARYNRMLADIFKASFEENTAMTYPPLNLSSDANNIYVHAQIPGMPLEDVELTLTDKTLVLKGERTKLHGKYFRQERHTGFFHRVINITTPFDHDAVTATAKHGILTVTLPKAEEVKSRSIHINVG